MNDSAVMPAIKYLSNALALVAATECRRLDEIISSLTVPLSTNPVARELHLRSQRLTKVIRALDALNDEARSAQ